MVTQSQRFIDFPPAVLGCILGHLNWCTGTPEITNEEDLKAFRLYVGNLALTCRAVYNKVNSVEVTKIFCNAAGKRYGCMPLDIAASVNTLGARTWIWEESQENGDRVTYKGIHQVYEILAEGVKKAKEAGLEIRLVQEKPTLQSYVRCKPRLTLQVGSSPERLMTPLGGVGISCVEQTKDAGLFLTAWVLRQLNASFIEAELKPRRKDGKTSFKELEIPNAVSSPLCADAAKPLSLEDFEGKRGCTDRLIWSASHPAYYEIPSQDQDFTAKPRSAALREAIWEMFENKRLDKPIFDKPKVDGSQPLIPIPSPQFADVPSLIHKVRKTLLDLLLQEVILKENLQGIDFWIGEDCLRIPCDDQDMGTKMCIRGLTECLEIFSKGKIGRCSIRKDTSFEMRLPKDAANFIQEMRDALQTVPDQMVQELQMGWKKADLKRDGAGIGFKRSEELYDLYISPNTWVASPLSWIVSGVLGKQKICVGNSWEYVGPEAGTNYTQSPTYLWIPKKRSKEVVSKLGLKV